MCAENNKGQVRLSVVYVTDVLRHESTCTYCVVASQSAFAVLPHAAHSGAEHDAVEMI